MAGELDAMMSLFFLEAGEALAFTFLAEGFFLVAAFLSFAGASVIPRALS